MRELTYTFRPVERCNMCAAPRDRFRILGLRLNRSQGLRPKSVDGIAVSVKQCGMCGLIFADPQPIPVSLSDHYHLAPEDYWPDLEWTSGYFGTEIALAKELIGFRRGMKALDIGAGLGKCMRALKDAGFEPWGIEPSKPFRDRAVAAMGITPDRLQQVPLEEAVFPDGQFDFITFGAVLEHLYDPSAALRRVLPWLAPGGTIQVEVPSADHFISKLINLYFRLKGTNYVTHISPMHVPFHLYEFTLRSFEMNGRLNGYQIGRHHYEVCAILYVPRFLHPPLRWWMKQSRTGMQLTLFLRSASR